MTLTACHPYLQTRWSWCVDQCNEPSVRHSLGPGRAWMTDVSDPEIGDLRQSELTSPARVWIVRRNTIDFQYRHRQDEPVGTLALAMYSVKVTGTSGPGEPASSKQQALLAEDSGVGTSSGALSEDAQDIVPFSAGNPRVEHLTGTVRLYRHAPRPAPRAPPWNRGPNTDPDLPVRG